MPTVVFSTNTTGADYGGTEDARLVGNQATTNFGSTADWTCYDFVSPDISSSWIKEDLSVLPAGCTITDAYYELYTVNTGETAIFNFYRCRRAVTEAGVTFNTYDGTNSWTTGGGQDTTNDRENTILCTLSPTAGAGYKATSSNTNLIAFIQGVVNGTITNYGLITGFPTNGAVNQFLAQSSEGTDGQRPKLTVTYTTGSGSATTAWLRA